MTVLLPFVGRRRELQELEQAFVRARGGTGGLAIVQGELGIGKTRLVHEFLQSARNAGAITTLGHWYESAEMPDYVGLRQAVLPLLGRTDVRRAIDARNGRTEDVARLGPEFAPAAGAPSTALEQPTAEERYRLWRGVHLVIEAAASVAPLVVALDDIQWCDEASLELLTYLAGQIADCRVLLVGTYRSEDVGAQHPLGAALTAFARVPNYVRLPLEGLSRDEVSELASRLSQERLGAPCVDDIYGQTRGNPLFVEELTRHVMRLGPVSIAGDRPVELPPSLQHLVRRRLENVSEDCQRLLSVAAVVGGEFDIVLLGRLVDIEPSALGRGMAEALAESILVETGPGVLAFSHPMMRTSIYTALPLMERLAMHLEVAHGIEQQRGGNAELHAREIARHLIAAGGLADPAKTARYCLAGARQARAAFAFDECLKLLQGALRANERLATPNPAGRAELLVELGYAETALGRLDEALRVYREALAVHEGLGNAPSATDVRRWMAAALMHYGRWHEALEVTAEALDVAEERASDAYLGLLGNHSLALVLTGRMYEAGPWVERLQRLAFDERTRAVASHSAAGWCAWGAGDRTQALEHFARARTLFLRCGLEATAAQVTLDQAIAAYFLGDVETCREALDAAEEVATSAGRDSTLADVPAVRGLVHVHRGEWDAAHAQYERWRAMTETIGATNYGHFARRGRALEQYWRAGPEAALAELDLSFPLDQALVPLLRQESGQGPSGVEPLAGAIVPDGRGIYWLAAALPLVAALSAEDPARASCFYDALRYHEGCLFDWHLVDPALGRIAAADGRWDDAERHFTDAAAFCEARGLRPLLAHVLHQHGVALLQRRSPRERHRARGLLERARDIARELGLPYLEQRVGRPLVRPRRGRPPVDGRSLTDREREVLLYLAEGKSNRQIAKDMVLSAKTVEHHVESIFLKLEVHSRAAAVRSAIDRGLLDTDSNTRA